MATLGRLQTVWTGVAGSPFYTTHHFFMEGQIAQAQGVVTAWRTFLNAFVNELRSGLSAQIGSEILLFESSTGLANGALAVTSLPVNFGSSSEALPPATQALIQLGTGTFVGGRRLRGRTFIPGGTELSNSNVGQPVLAFRDALRVNFQTFVDTTPCDLVIYSDVHHAYSSVTTVQVWAQWAQLRSRRD